MRKNQKPAIMEYFIVNRQLSVIKIAMACVFFLTVSGFAQVGSNVVDWGVHPLGFSRVGSSGWQFLKLPCDARSAAMGGITTAVAFGNAGSALNNPASTVDVKDMDIEFTTMNWVADIKYNTLSFVKNIPGIGAIGINCIYVNYGDMIRTTVEEGFGPSGNSLGVIPITEGKGTFSAHDMAIGLSYSQQITVSLQVGGTLRYVEEQIDDAKMGSWALNIGTMYWTGLGSLRISMLGRNFGSDGQFQSFSGRQALAPANVRLPMEFVIGAAYDVYQTDLHRVTVAGEYLKPNDGPDKYNVGVEYFAFSNIYMRGGYKFNYDEGTYTLGVGAEYGVSENYGIKFDYAYTNVGRFDAVHVLSCGFVF